MKNHFFFPYVGNKRREVEGIYPALNFDGIKTICEPFCGSGSMSFFISQQQPLKFKYLLNDSCPFLFKLLFLIRNGTPEEIKEFEKKINDFCDYLNEMTTDETRKIRYNEIAKMNTFESSFFIKKYFNIREGLYPTFSRIKKFVPCILSDYPMFNFLKTENVEITNMDAVDFYKNHSVDESALLLIDPPYLMAVNDFYVKGKRMNIYEFLYNNPIEQEKARTYLILENIWIIKLLFHKYIIDEYAKKYAMKQKETTHVVVYNKK